MAILTKICGISDADMLDVAVGHGAAMIGFVHFPKSPRHVGVEKISELVTHMAGRALTVAVVVNPDDELLEQLVAADVDVIQLHGSESPARLAEVQRLTGKQVIKAVAVSNAEDLERLADYNAADYILLDAKAPAGADLPGGNGVRFDWSILADADLPSNLILSGGLTAENVIEAVGISGVALVDVSSGVESQLGVKDATKIEQFMKAIDGI